MQASLNFMKIALQALMILVSSTVFSQTHNEKIISILKANGSIEGYKSFIIDMTINPLKYNSNKSDSLKLVEIEKKLTDKEIEKRLSKAYSEVYNESEIDEIYKFYNSATGIKLLMSSDILEEKFRNSFLDVHNDIKSILDEAIAKNQKESEDNREIPIPSEKEDGFYSVTNLPNSNYKLENLILALKPEVKKSEILEIRASKDELNRNIINLTLTKKGAKKFKILTENNIGRPIAIVLGKMLISAPRVLTEIPDGRIQISGNFTDEDIQKYVNSLEK